MARFKQFRRAAQSSGSPHPVWVNLDASAWVEGQFTGRVGKSRVVFLVTDKHGDPEALALEEEPEVVISEM